MRTTGLTFLGVVLLLIVLAVGMFVGVYNRLQTMDENINSNWAQVENQLKRRNDLIPNLVNTVKGYATHENEIFTNIANARAKLSGAMGSNNVKQVQQSYDELNTALSRLLVIVENYPNLKADKVFIGLQDELAGTENRLAVARKDYNDSVRTLNAEIRRFPVSIVANIANIRARDYFEITETEKAVPEVKF